MLLKVPGSLIFRQLKISSIESVFGDFSMFHGMFPFNYVRCFAKII